MRYFAYLRKSSEQEESQVLSLGDQKTEVKRKFPDLNIVDEDWLPESHTAFVPGKRPVFESMIERIKKGEADGIVAWHPNRLSRNEIDAATITYLVRTGVIKDLKFVSYTFENTPDGIKWLQNTLSDAQYSSARSGVDIKRALTNKALRGDYPGLAPLGYKNTPERLKGEREILDDEDRIRLFRYWFDLILTGKYSVEESLNVVTKLGLRNRRNKVVSRAAAFEIMHNVFYAGYFDYGGIRYKGNHTPIISMTEWKKIQDIIANKGKKAARTLDEEKLKEFQGMLKCGECGATITMSRHLKQYKNGSSQTFWYYQCTKKLGPCKQSYMPANLFEPQIFEYLKRLELDPIFSGWIRKVLKRRNHEEFEFSKSSREMITKQLNILDDRKEILGRLKIDGAINEESYRNKMNAILVEESDLREKQSIKTTQLWEETLDNTISFGTSMMTLFERGDIYTRQMVLKILGLNLIMKDKKVYIQAKDAFIFLKDLQESVFNKTHLLEPKTDGVLDQNEISAKSVLSCAEDRT